MTSRPIPTFWVLLISYCSGMIKHVEDNEYHQPRWRTTKQLFTGVAEEGKEAWQALTERQWRGLFWELNDVWHSWVTAWAMSLSPKSAWLCPWFWIFVGLMTILAPLKHGRRFYDYKCIRHKSHCLARDHRCSSLAKFKI